MLRLLTSKVDDNPILRLPDGSAAVSIAGSALIEIGRAEEGLALLGDAEDGNAFNVCLVHVFRALGHFKLGNTDATRKQLPQSQALFRYREWQDLDIERIVQRIDGAIGGGMKASGT